MPEESNKSYDVFLSHHSADKPVVEELAMQLREAGLSVFLDNQEISPGEPWVAALERALLASHALIVCIGASSLGPWAEREVDAALERSTRDPSFALIPVLLPGASRSQQDQFSLFLRQHQ